MILEKDNAQQCARMTKIRLSDAEVAAYEKELKDLFTWVEALAEVDTSSVSETSVARAAYLRPDDPVENAALSAALVRAFNDQENSCAKVKKVL